MELSTLESWFPGETNSRVGQLKKVAAQFKTLPEGVEIMPISYNDIECMWLRFKLNDRIQSITIESCYDILDGDFNLKVEDWFKD